MCRWSSKFGSILLVAACVACQGKSPWEPPGPRPPVTIEKLDRTETHLKLPGPWRITDLARVFETTVAALRSRNPGLPFGTLKEGTSLVVFTTPKAMQEFERRCRQRGLARAAAQKKAMERRAQQLSRKRRKARRTPRATKSKRRARLKSLPR